jgi:hypothetical protein
MSFLISAINVLLSLAFILPPPPPPIKFYIIAAILIPADAGGDP